MAAAVESTFDIKVTLVEGHNGIYEVSISNEVIHTNKCQCSQDFPSDGQILKQIGQFIGVEPKPDMLAEPQSNQEQDPYSTLPNQSSEGNITEPLPIINQTESDSGCGCGPVNSIPSSGAGCCDPKAGNSGKKERSLFKKLLAGGLILAALVLAAITVAKKSGWYGDMTGQFDSVGVASSGEIVATSETTPVLGDMLTELVGKHEAVFALLPCDHEDHTQELREKVSPAIHKLQARGKRTDLVVVDPSSPAYTLLIELHAAESFPCLAVIGASCASSLLSDDFTEERLFGAFVTATSPKSSSSCSAPCGTQPSDSKSAATPCCPK